MKQQRMRSRNNADGRRPCGGSYFIQPLCRSSVCSARQRKYGIQPMSPSVSAKRSDGKRCQNDAHNKSPSVYTDITLDRLIATGAGAFGAVDARCDDEPTW